MASRSGGTPVRYAEATGQIWFQCARCGKWTPESMRGNVAGRCNRYGCREPYREPSPFSYSREWRGPFPHPQNPAPPTVMRWDEDAWDTGKTWD